MRLIHNLTHQHAWAVKPGVGEIVACGWRLPWTGMHVMFRPDLTGADWHPVDNGALKALIESETAEQAMAVMRMEWL
jgi:hypothetical protein